MFLYIVHNRIVLRNNLNLNYFILNRNYSDYNEFLWIKEENRM